MQIDSQGYVTIGVIAVAIIGWLMKWWITKTLDSKFSKREREDQEFRKEQIEDTYRQLKGQQVMTNSLLVILRHMTTGNHIEDLEHAQVELSSFQRDNEAAMMKKAAKYNLSR